MQREEVLARAPYLAPRSWSVEDMLGTDVDDFNELPVEGLKEYWQMDMNDMPRRSHAHHI